MWNWNCIFWSLFSHFLLSDCCEWGCDLALFITLFSFLSLWLFLLSLSVFSPSSAPLSLSLSLPSLSLSLSLPLSLSLYQSPSPPLSPSLPLPLLHRSGVIWQVARKRGHWKTLTNTVIALLEEAYQSNSIDLRHKNLVANLEKMEMFSPLQGALRRTNYDGVTLRVGMSNRDYSLHAKIGFVQVGVVLLPWRSVAPPVFFSRLIISSRFLFILNFCILFLRLLPLPRRQVSDHVTLCRVIRGTFFRAQAVSWS